MIMSGVGRTYSRGPSIGYRSGSQSSTGMLYFTSCARFHGSSQGRCYAAEHKSINDPVEAGYIHDPLIDAGFAAGAMMHAPACGRRQAVRVAQDVSNENASGG